MIPVTGCEHCSFSDECVLSVPGDECAYYNIIQYLFSETEKHFEVGQLSLCQIGQWVYAVKKMLVEMQR